MIASAQENSTGVSPSLQQLESAIADRLDRVEEFHFIRERAAQLGVRAWLFGGTAAGFGHYVNWDLKRQVGDVRFQSDRFDYDYSNIYSSTQDSDIVIDGTLEQARELEKALQVKYPHLQGSKSAWEVRLLRYDLKDKEALLNNPNYLNQNTDSNSTGMIEITRPQDGESAIRDLRDWSTKESQFLRDLHDDQIHFYFSETHGQTARALRGLNPPILSVIRCLTKAFQYGLEIGPEDLARIKKIIDQFDPREPQNSYVSTWIEKNGKKLIQNAVNIEDAWNTLEKLGLRAKLIAFSNDSKKRDSLAVWLSKEPLRTSHVGGGQGKTARELGLDVVAHETDNIAGYEAITRAHTGEANVLISREHMMSERAVQGEGFYTQAGREGVGGSGLTIRFHLDPNAKEGSDFDIFTLQDGNRYVIIKNKAAIRVIPESLTLTPLEYFRMLATGKSVERSDQGIWVKMERRVSAKLGSLSTNEAEELLKLAKEHLENKEILHKVFHQILPNAVSDSAARFLLDLIQKGKWDEEICEILAQPQWGSHPELVRALLDRKDSNLDSRLIMDVLPKWPHHPEFVAPFIGRNSGRDYNVAVSILSRPEWSTHPELVLKMIRTGKSDSTVCREILSKPAWKDHPELVQAVIDTGRSDLFLAIGVLSQPHWENHPEWVQTLIERGSEDRAIAEFMLSKPHWRENPALLRLTGGLPPTVDNLRAAYKRARHLPAAHHSCEVKFSDL